jgi:putative ABC transport system substrate-binding protein
LLPLEVRDVGEPDAAFAKVRASAPRVLNCGLLARRAAQIARLAATQRLPAICGLRMHVDRGGLMAHDPDLDDSWLRAAVFVDKMLMGAKLRDRPEEQPTEFKLVIDPSVAKAREMNVLRSLLVRANELRQ